MGQEGYVQSDLCFTSSSLIVSVCRHLLSSGRCYLNMQPEPATESVQRHDREELHSFTQLHAAGVSVSV